MLPWTRLTTRADSPDSTLTTIVNLECKPALSPPPSQFLVYLLVSPIAVVPAWAPTRRSKYGPGLGSIVFAHPFSFGSRRKSQGGVFSRRLCARRTFNSSLYRSPGGRASSCEPSVDCQISPAILTLVAPPSCQWDTEKEKKKKRKKSASFHPSPLKICSTWINTS